MTMKTPRYHLGCPVWALAEWKGSLFTSAAPRRAWLEQYASVFNTVEGNSTFYALPSLDTAKRWAEAVPEGFKFALKFPKAISHDKRLLNAEPETAAFVEILTILHDAGGLGPSFLQLPSGFAPQRLDELENYLRNLPSHFPYAVEVRHPEFFDDSQHGIILNDLLRDMRIDRVIFDSRALFSSKPSDSTEVESQERKPNLPVHQSATGQHPMIRFVGLNDLESNRPWIEEWARQVAEWISAGLRPFVFTHAPEQSLSAPFARMFHDELSSRLTIPPMNVWPGESEPSVPKQMELF